MACKLVAGLEVGTDTNVNINSTPGSQMVTDASNFGHLIDSCLLAKASLEPVETRLCSPRLKSANLHLPDGEVDLYACLGLPSTASQAAIKTAVRAGRLRLHPDKAASVHAAQDARPVDVVNAERRLELEWLERAWCVLGDPGCRQLYDALRRQQTIMRESPGFPVQGEISLATFVRHTSTDDDDVVEESEHGLANDVEQEFAATRQESEDGAKASSGVSHTSTSDLGAVSHSVEEDAAKDEEGEGEEIDFEDVDEVETARSLMAAAERDLETVFLSPCRCGGFYTLEGVGLLCQAKFASCSDCSLAVRVIYPTQLTHG